MCPLHRQVDPQPLSLHRRPTDLPTRSRELLDYIFFWLFSCQAMSNSTPWTAACQADLICQVSIKFPQVKACQGIFRIKYHFILWNDFSFQGFFVCDSEFTLDVIIPYRSLYTGLKKTHTQNWKSSYSRDSQVHWKAAMLLLSFSSSWPDSD